MRYFVLFTAVLIFAACAPYPTAGETVPGIHLANAQATATAANLVISATQGAAAQQTAQAAQIIAEQTIVSAQATGEAEAVATRSAQATAGAIEATAQYIQIQETEVALSMMVAQATEQFERERDIATATAAAASTASAERIANAALLREDEREKMRLENDRAALINIFVPVALGSFALTMFVFAVFIVWRGVYLHRNSVTTVPLNGVEYPLVRDTNGEWRTIPNARPALPAPHVNNSEPVALPAPRREMPITAEGHFLIVGPTGSRKTTSIHHAIRGREGVTVIDPHAAPDDWPENVNVIGGGGDYDAIGEFLTRMGQQLDERVRQRNDQGIRQFPPLTVAADEFPAIVSRLRDQSVTENWMYWMQEGRKFSLYMVVGTQSTRVSAMGIKGRGDVLRNFPHVLYLGAEASNRYPEITAQQEWPAVYFNQTSGRAMPVVIPRVERQPSSNGSVPAPIINQTAAEEAEVIEVVATAEDGQIPQEEITRIIYWGQRQNSMRAVEREVYGYNGGAATRKVRAVLLHYEEVRSMQFPATVALRHSSSGATAATSGRTAVAPA